MFFFISIATTPSKIPLVDLQRNYASIRPAVDAKIREVLDVKDEKEFLQLWGDPDTYLNSFLTAHLNLVKFVPGAEITEFGKK